LLLFFRKQESSFLKERSKELFITVWERRCGKQAPRPSAGRKNHPRASRRGRGDAISDARLAIVGLPPLAQAEINATPPSLRPSETWGASRRWRRSGRGKFEASPALNFSLQQNRIQGIFYWKSAASIFGISRHRGAGVVDENVI